MNIYPREIEEVLYTHPAVVDCAVFGVPDDRLGEALHAVVEVRTDVTADELREHCVAHLADFKVPKTIELVDELPRQPNGKVLKRVLGLDASNSAVTADVAAMPTAQTCEATEAPIAAAASAEAGSDIAPLQAFRFRSRAYGLLFHLEIETEGIEALCRECPSDLERAHVTASKVSIGFLTMKSSLKSL